MAITPTIPKLRQSWKTDHACRSPLKRPIQHKFYSENCLLQQEFVRGDVFTGTVEQYIADAAKKLGGKITFVDAIRFEKGEGIEKKQENFAEEIAKMVKG